MSKLFKVILILAIAPMVAGVAIFFVWVLARANWLIPAGIFTIYAGICAVAIGLICFVIYIMRSWRSRAIPRRRLMWQTIGVLGLFLANFVMAGGAVSGSIMIDTLYTVRIVNQSSVPLESACIRGGGVEIYVGSVPVGKTVRRSFWIRYDGTLILTGTHGSKVVTETIAGYVTYHSGGDKTVIVDNEGHITAKDRRTGVLSQ